MVRSSRMSGRQTYRVLQFSPVALFGGDIPGGPREKGERRHPAEAVVGRLGVVGLQPPGRYLPDLGQGGEEPGIEHLLAIGAVEALDEGVLIRLPRLDVADRDPTLLAPHRQGLSDELRPVVAAEGLRGPVLRDELLQQGHHPHARQRGADFHGQRLAIPLIEDLVGYALYLAQEGGQRPRAKLVRGDLRGLVQVVADDEGNTYRAVYTVKLRGAVYVLHVFQKKSTHGIATPKHVLDLVKQRLADAREHHAAHYGGRRPEMAERIKVTMGSGNVFADLELPNPEERLAKAQLALEISRLIERRGLTQRATAQLMGVDQPKVSHILRGRLADYSTERLIGFVRALGQDVDIVTGNPPAAGVVRGDSASSPERPARASCSSC